MKLSYTFMGILYLCLVFISSNVHAHPVTFKGGTAITVKSLPNNVSTEVNHSFNPNVAASGVFINRKSATKTLSGFTMGVNLLLKRWNGTHSQANVYALGSMGIKTSEPAGGLLSIGGLQLDFETLRFYTATSSRMIWAGQDKWVDTTVRIGFAPYEADYTSLQSWIVAQVMYMHTPDGDRVIPGMLMRFFYRTVLWELGADLYGRPWIQLMAHY